MACVDLTLLSAFETWWLGQKLDGMCIHGFETIWIARTAKIIGYFSAVTLLIDILGPEKTVASAVRARRNIKRITLIFMSMFSNRKRVSPLLKRAISAIQILFIFGIFVSIYIFAPAKIPEEITSRMDTGTIILNYAAIYAFVSLKASFLVLAILSFFVAIAAPSVFVLEIFSRIMLNEKVCHRMRVASGLLLTGAFLTDLLMS